MSLSSGTPIWLSLLLSIGAVAGTHFLTLYRENRKRSADSLASWKKECDDLLQEVCDEAIEHYTNPKTIDDTQASAQRILSKIRRLGLKLRETHCIDASKSKQTTALVQELRNVITEPPDFQMTDRKVREPNDELMESIRACEERLSQSMRLPRKMKD